MPKASPAPHLARMLHSASLTAPPLLPLLTDATPLVLPSITSGLPATAVASDLQHTETVLCSLYASLRSRASAAVEKCFYQLLFSLQARDQPSEPSSRQMDAINGRNSTQAPLDSENHFSEPHIHPNPLLCQCGSLKHYSLAFLFLRRNSTSITQQLAPTVSALYSKLMEPYVPCPTTKITTFHNHLFL